MVMQSRISTRKNSGRGNFGAGESDGGDGEGLLGETKKPQNKKQGGGRGDGKQQGTKGTYSKPPAKKPTAPNTVTWHQVNGSDTYASISGPFPLTGDVPFDQVVWTCQREDKTTARRYTSVSVACSVCSKAIAANDSSGHNPRCFVSKCNRCHNFGHIGINCLHV
jgi:hypothetical protein